jgi:hypothetical protein
MPRLARIVASVGAVGLAAYALSVLLADPGYDEAPTGPVPDVSAQTRVRADTRDRFVEYARAVQQPQSATLPGDDLVDDDDGPPVTLGPEAVDESEARHGFEHIMKRVEALGSKRRRLTQDEWRQTYRAANDAFSALSNHLDARDADQRAELEEAYFRLKEGLGGIRVKGDKFGVP